MGQRHKHIETTESPAVDVVSKPHNGKVGKTRPQQNRSRQDGAHSLHISGAKRAKLSAEPSQSEDHSSEGGEFPAASGQQSCAALAVAIMGTMPRATL
jgi:hypothetical protein